MGKKFLVFVGFLLLSLLWFWKEAFSGYLFCFGDLTYYFYPYRFFMAQAIRSGVIPLWNPYIHMGFPFLATLQPGIFYPLSLLYYFLPFDLAFNWFLILHYPLGGFFMYLLGRELKMSEAGAVGAGLVFAFSGYLSSVLHMPTSLASVIWLPLALLFFYRIICPHPRPLSHPPSSFGLRRTGRERGVIWLSLSLALMFLGGEPTVLFGTFWVLVFYLLFSEPRAWKIGLSGIALSFIIAAGLSAVQLLPFVELVYHSARSPGISFEHAARFSVSLHKLLELVFPYISSISWYPWLSHEWLKVSYLGVIPALLSIIALFYFPDRRVRWLAAAVVFLLLVMAGVYSPFPLYQLLFNYVPGFNFFRYPAKFAFVLTFIVSILCGMGMDCIRNDLFRMRKVIRAGVMAALAMLMVFFWADLNQEKVFFILRPWFGNEIAMGYEGLVKGVTVPRDIMNFAILTVLIASFFVWLELSRRLKIKPWITAVGLLVLIFVDLYTAAAGSNLSIKAADYRVTPENVKLLLADRNEFRYLISPGAFRKSVIDDSREFRDYGRALLSVRNRLTYNQNMLYGIAGLDGYESIKGADQNMIGQRVLGLNSLAGVRILDLLNVKYLVTSSPFKERGYKLLTVNKEEFKDGKIYLYENENVLPRSFYVPKAKVIRDRNQALDYISGPRFDPEKEVVLEEEVSAPFGFWFTSEWFYPGWKAYVNGKEARIYRANYMFRAVPVPSEKSEVKFVYDPPLFKLGAAVSLLTLLGLAISLFRLRR